MEDIAHTVELVTSILVALALSAMALAVLGFFAVVIGCLINDAIKSHKFRKQIDDNYKAGRPWYWTP